TGEGRFGNWLENIVDWNLSRSRFWGTPLPIWKTLSFHSPFGSNQIDDLGSYDEICVGMKEQLIVNTSKGGWEVEGYLVDFKKLHADIESKNQGLIDSIDSYNENLGELKKNFYIDFNRLQESADKKSFDKSALKD